MLAFIFGPPLAWSLKNESLSRLLEDRFYCIDSIYRYIRANSHPTKAKVRICVDQLFENLDKIPQLLERILESVGFKHYDSNDLLEWVKSLSKHEIELFKAIFFSHILVDELHFNGFDHSERAAFKFWGDVALRATQKLFTIAQRTHNLYDILIFLNSPTIDEESELKLAEIVINGQRFELTIGYATDELLSRLFSSTTNAQLKLINTAIQTRFAIPVNGPVDSYLRAYEFGANIAERVVDCLRLTRTEDIGVIALEVFPTEDFTPQIRKTYDESFRSELALVIPKRFSFEIEPTPPLSPEDRRRIGELLSRYPDISSTQGLDVAIRRFRSSCEKYLPSDPERLLDMAFAFEALFLNDNENKELSYRLSLRAARFLSNEPEERERTFTTLKKLYDFRSKIAHGETLGKMKQSEVQKLNEVLSQSPRILRNAIIQMMEGNGPIGLKSSEKIGEWWRKLELS